MENPIEEVGKNWKGLPKWAKIAIPSVIGVIVIYAVMKSKSSSGTLVASQPLGNASPGTSTAQQAYDFASAQKASTAALMDAQKQSEQSMALKFDSYTKTLNDALTTSVTNLNSNVAGIKDDLSKQAATNAAVLSGFSTQVNAAMTAAEAAAAAQSKLQSVVDLFTKSQGSYNSGYSSGGGTYTSSTSTSSSSNVLPSGLTPEISAPTKLGSTSNTYKAPVTATAPVSNPNNQKQYLDNLVSAGGGNGEWAKAQIAAGKY